MHRHAIAALVTGIALAGPTAPAAEALTCTPTTILAGSLTGGGLAARLGSRIGIAALGTAIPGTLPVGAVGALMFGATVVIACTAPYWGPAATPLIAKFATWFGATALGVALAGYLKPPRRSPPPCRTPGRRPGRRPETPPPTGC